MSVREYDTICLTVSGREFCTMLAALRAWQERTGGHDPEPDWIDEIASEAGRPLDAEEIDALCERINADENHRFAPAPAAEDYGGAFDGFQVSSDADPGL